MMIAQKNYWTDYTNPPDNHHGMLVFMRYIFYLFPRNVLFVTIFNEKVSVLFFKYLFLIFIQGNLFSSERYAIYRLSI